MIKVDQVTNKETGIITFIFECNSVDDHDTLDKLRVAILGDHARRGTYQNSNTLLIDVRVPETLVS